MGRNSLNFDETLLLEQLRELPHVTAHVIALSGGADSVSLLVALHQLQHQWPIPLRAIHVNHQLQPEAGQWEAHCAALCEQLSIPLQVQRIRVQQQPGESLEMAARRQRYAIFDQQLNSNEGIVLGHHRDDQVETVLLNLFNGAGPGGLAGMPAWRRLASGALLLRPLLAVPRTALRAYLRAQAVAWVEDPSNQAARFDRNYLRHSVLPLIQARWQGVEQCITRAAQIQKQYLQLGQDEIQRYYRDVYDFNCAALHLARLNALPTAIRRLCLRHWLLHTGKALNLQEKQLEAVERDLLPAGTDTQARFCKDGICLRVYQGHLYKLPEHPPAQPQTYHLQPGEDLHLPALGLFIEGRVLRQQFPEADTLTVTFRTENNPLIRDDPGKLRIKKRFQASRIEPWKRRQVPMFYSQGRFLGVWGYGNTGTERKKH